MTHTHKIEAEVPDERRGELAADWRRRAAQLERQAAGLRRSGFLYEAADREEAAADYWRAADAIELYGSDAVDRDAFLGF